METDNAPPPMIQPYMVTLATPASSLTTTARLITNCEFFISICVELKANGYGYN